MSDAPPPSKEATLPAVETNGAETNGVSKLVAVRPMEPSQPWPSAIVAGDLTKAKKEWLHTNGAGSFASSTVAGMHTRRYHGLLVAALDPPRDRHVFLSHVDTTVIGPPRPPAPGARYAARPTWELAKHQFPRVDPTTTPFHLTRFDQDPLPRWTFAVAGGELEVTLALVRGENAIVLRYAFRGATPLDLKLRPLIAARHFHKLQREHGGMVQRVELRPAETNGQEGRTRPIGEMRVQPRRDLPRVCFRYEGTFVGSPDWWRRFEYLAERDRGLDFEEDLWTPGVFEVPLREGDPVWLVAGVERLPAGEPEALLLATRDALLSEDPGEARTLVERKLTIAAGVFRADLTSRPGVIAGYPWFEVWWRDALIALPGLYLATGKRDGAIAILRALCGAMTDGLVPLRVPEPENGSSAEADYGSADATLWLFEAARHVAAELGRTHAFVTDELLPALREAFESVARGTTNGIHLSEDGLFVAGREGDALTWMDSRVEGAPVASRAGCAIELTALWARGAETLSDLARAAGDDALADRALTAARRAREAFHTRFWCDETGYPYDTIAESKGEGGAGCDASVRPNAVIALAIDPACFTDDRARLVLERARRDLVTPAGLRTLAPADPRYMGRYGGDVKSRDGASHQGATRPWLLGFYARAALRARFETPEAIERLLRSAAQLEIALGHTPELADGDAPHAPGGAVAHAAGVAELLRALVWDVQQQGG